MKAIKLTDRGYRVVLDVLTDRVLEVSRMLAYNVEISNPVRLAIVDKLALLEDARAALELARPVKRRPPAWVQILKNARPGYRVLAIGEAVKFLLADLVVRGAK